MTAARAVALANRRFLRYRQGDGDRTRYRRFPGDRNRPQHRTIHRTRRGDLPRPHVTNDESVATVVKQVIDQFGHIDVLVNNVGVGATGADADVVDQSNQTIPNWSSF